MPTMQLLPGLGTVPVRTGTLLIDALLENSMKIQMSCGGSGICATCHVNVRSGIDQLSPVTPRERRTLNLLAESTEHSRLACQAEIRGDGLVVELPKGMYVEKMEDLVAMIGSRAPMNILHPITGMVLIPIDKIVTRTLLEQSRKLDQEVRDMRAGLGMNSSQSHSNFKLAERTSIQTGAGASASSGSDSVRFASNINFTNLRSFDSRLQKIPGPIITTPNRDFTSQSTSSGSSSLNDRLLPQVIETGTKIGKFLMLECVGDGSSGQVFRALHTSLNIPVAIKFLRFDHEVSSPRLLERFRADLRLLAQLNHVNVTHILDFEEALPSPFVVMEFVNGSSLQELLNQSGKIRLDRALRILDQTVLGLEACRGVGIIHCDLKPSNILLTRDGTVKIADFGLSQGMILRNRSKDAESVIKNSLAYMSPETLDGVSKVDHRTDIYSLGIILFQMVTGVLPFSAKNKEEIIQKKLSELVPLAHEISLGLPIDLSEWIVALTAKKLDARPGSYTELRDKIRTFLSCADGF